MLSPGPVRVTLGLSGDTSAHCVWVADAYMNTSSVTWHTPYPSLPRLHSRLFRAPPELTDPASSEAEEAAPVTSEDERKMLCFYYKQIMKICAGLNFPTKVKVMVARDDVMPPLASFAGGGSCDGPGSCLLYGP